MADKDTILKEKVSHSGIFDFAGFYKYAYDWFEDEGYGVIEKKYTEKVVGNARNIYMEWVADKSFGDYFKVVFELKWWIDNLTDVEVEIDGEKKKMNKGVITLEIKGDLLKDPASKWDASPALQFMRQIYNKYIVPQKLENMGLKTMADAQTFKDELKAYLDLTGKR